MRRLLTTLTGAILAAGMALAQDNVAIEDVILDQLDAFTDRDTARAFDHASPMIQSMFGTPRVFAHMVEQGYPMVWNNREVRFLDLRELNGAWWQQVMIRDAQGNLHLLDYQMIEIAGDWQINGVRLLPVPGVGV